MFDVQPCQTLNNYLIFGVIVISGIIKVITEPLVILHITNLNLIHSLEENNEWHTAARNTV